MRGAELTSQIFMSISHGTSRNCSSWIYRFFLSSCTCNRLLIRAASSARLTRDLNVALPAKMMCVVHPFLRDLERTVCCPPLVRLPLNALGLASDPPKHRTLSSFAPCLLLRSLKNDRERFGELHNTTTGVTRSVLGISRPLIRN